MSAPADWVEAGIAAYFAEREAGCSQEVALALLHAGELDEAAQAQVRRHLASCAECREDLAALSLPAPQGAAVLPLRFPKRVWLFAAPAVALAASLLLFFLPSPDRLRPKGGWSLEVAAQRGTAQFRAPSGTTLREGDQLGFFYSAPKDGYLTVLYASADEAPVQVFPALGPQSAFVRAGSQVPLADGAKVGAGAGCEWVVGFFTERPLSASEARRRVRALLGGRQGCALPSAEAEVQVVTVRR